MNLDLANVQLDALIIDLHNGAEKLIASQSKIDHPIYSNQMNALRCAIAKSYSETALELIEIKKLING